MAIFRGVGGAVGSTTSAVISEATEAAQTATEKAAEAAASASNAATSKINAATSASNALSSATSAAASAALYEDFLDRYLGAKATAPTTDNDGNPLQVGVLYYSENDEELLVWSGSAWVSPLVSPAIRDSFAGDGSTVAFTLSRDPSTEANTQVYINGIYQNKSTYSVSGTTLTLSTAPEDGDSIEVMSQKSTSVLMADTDNATYTASGAGAVTRTLNEKLGDTVSVKDFGAVGDGVTDDTAALIKASQAITDNTTMYFPNGTYLVSHQGFSDFTSAFGNSVFDIVDVDNIRIIGDGATIKTVNHDITTYGGLRAFTFTNCNGATVSGFNFDMTFTGYKMDSAYYPQCGAIEFTNASAADGQNPNDLSGDILIEHCEFKLFHPLGCWGQNADPANYYNGDNNNAFKVFTVFVSSPYQADQYENTGRNCTIRDCRIKEGHNGYGFWVWATYNAVFDNLVAESFVTKYTEVDTGNILNGGVPFIRHHQFRTEGAKVTNCYFRAKPTSERAVAGFEGSGNFINFTTNINEDLAKGEYIVTNNIITHGGGDPVYSVDTTIILAYGYGNYIYDGNIFDGHDGEDNGGTCILNAISNGSTGGGVGSVIVSNNTFGKWSKANNIQISTGNNTGSYNRRIQQVSVTGNLSLSQGQYFLFVGNNNTYTYDGVQSLNVSNNIIDGTYSNWDKNSTNSRAIRIKGTESTDNYIIKDNEIRSKYYGITDDTTNTNVNTFGNRFIDVTDHYYPAATVVETISGHEQGEYEAFVEGNSTTTLGVRELSSGNTLKLYQQAALSYLISSSDLVTYAQGSEVARFTSSGIKISSGKGIDFSASGSAVTSTSELFDDYEEGTWTPIYFPETGSFTTITYVSSGTYTKVGRLVTIFGTIRTTGVLDTTGASGDLLIGGLPYVCDSSVTGGGSDISHQLFLLGTDALRLGVRIAPASTSINLMKNTTNASSFPNGSVKVTEMNTSGGSFNNLITFTAQYQF